MTTGSKPTVYTVTDWAIGVFYIIAITLLVVFLGTKLFGPPQSEPIMPEIIVEETHTPDDVRDYWVRTYAERFETDVKWVSAISHAENTRGLRAAWSPNHCCVGLMQVNVRDWFGRFDIECEGSDLLNPRVNVCYGVLIWKLHLAECRQVVSCALRAYVGQVTNVRAGDRYVADVYNNWLEGI